MFLIVYINYYIKNEFYFQLCEILDFFETCVLSHPNRVNKYVCFTTEHNHCVRLTYGIPFYDVSLQGGVSLTKTASYIGVSPYVSPQREYLPLMMSTHKEGILF